METISDWHVYLFYLCYITTFCIWWYNAIEKGEFD